MNKYIDHVLSSKVWHIQNLLEQDDDAQCVVLGDVYLLCDQLEAKDTTIAQQAQDLEQANKRIEALEAMLSKKLDLIRCGIGGNYSGYPKENPLYIEVVELISNTKGAV